MNTEVHVPTRQIPIAAGTVCPACGGVDLEVFFRLADLPANCIALCRTREAALKVPKGTIELGFCQHCGAVTNVAFDPSKLAYDPRYDNSLHFSPSFQKYADGLARQLVRQYDLHGKSILEVGCGNGEFLSLICGLGGNRGIGFDPSFIPGRADLASGEGITIIRDYYSERYAEYKADFVICRHVLEHIATPQEFLRTMRGALAGNHDAAIFFELPDASFVFQNKGIWDVIYEHCFYYSAGALARLFSTCGFDVQNVSSTFNGQYLCLEARVSSQEKGVLGNAGGDLNSMREGARKFADEYECTLRYWEEVLGRLSEEGKRAVLWGAGAKGAMFVNAFRNVRLLEHVVDVNPHKRGLYIPGTGQEVVSPEFLKQYRPDVVFVANANYRDEISRQVSAFGIVPALFSI
jgi:SAM-dependent methyltransferase